LTLLWKLDFEDPVNVRFHGLGFHGFAKQRSVLVKDAKEMH